MVYGVWPMVKKHVHVLHRDPTTHDELHDKQLEEIQGHDGI